MANTRELPRHEWRQFFDLMSRALLGKRAQVEVDALDLGAQFVAEWIPMLGITYDDQDDLLDVALDQIDHLIRNPRQIVVEKGPVGIASVSVIDGKGTLQIVRLKAPLALPSPAAR